MDDLEELLDQLEEVEYDIRLGNSLGSDVSDFVTERAELVERIAALRAAGHHEGPGPDSVN